MSSKVSRYPGGPFSIAVVSAGLRIPSRTRTLGVAIAAAVAERVQSEIEVIDISAIWEVLSTLSNPNDGSPDVRRALDAVRRADLLVASSPIFKASYTGTFKYFFDLFDPDALIGKPVVLAATGGSERHSLALEHHFRPLFGFFSAATLPTAVYAVDRDIVDGKHIVDALRQRIESAATEAALALSQKHHFNAQQRLLSVAQSS